MQAYVGLMEQVANGPDGLREKEKKNPGQGLTAYPAI